MTAYVKLSNRAYTYKEWFYTYAISSRKALARLLRCTIEPTTDAHKYGTKSHVKADCSWATSEGSPVKSWQSLRCLFENAKYDERSSRVVARSGLKNGWLEHYSRYLM